MKKPKMTVTWLYNENEYGIREYKNWPIFVLAMSIFMMVVAIAAYGVFIAEANASGANILNYKDSFWLVFMAASTIGFGDFYPVTGMGRVIIGSMFLVGGAMAGVIIGLINSIFMSWSNTEIKNQELRQQNADIIAELKEAKDSYQQADLDNAAAIKELLAQDIAKADETNALLEQLLTKG